MYKIIAMLMVVVGTSQASILTYQDKYVTYDSFETVSNIQNIQLNIKNDHRYDSFNLQYKTDTIDFGEVDLLTEDDYFIATFDPTLKTENFTFSIVGFKKNKLELVNTNFITNHAYNIPEPATLVLIGISGCSVLFIRRLML